MGKWRTWLRRPREIEELSPAEGYRRWAADYGREPNAFQRLEAPALERLMGDVAGRRVLDLGAGKGRVARLAAERGASLALAADLSPAMLAGPGAFPGPKLAARIGGPLPCRDGAFDWVVCALVLGHVEDLGQAVESIAAALAPGGRLLVSDFHPYATLRGWRRTFNDPESGETRAIAQHLHLFSDYVAALGRAGLTVEALEEPRWQGTPVAFVLRARKAGQRGLRDATKRHKLAIELDSRR